MTAAPDHAPPMTPTTSLARPDRPRTASRCVWLVALALAACRPDPPPESPALANSPALAAPTTLAGPVVAIERIGSTRESDARAALITTTGAPYDPATIAGDVRALWRLGGVADVQVDARPAPGGVALRYRVTELPRVRKVDVAGGPPALTPAWQARVADIRDVAQDPAALRRLAEELRDELVAGAYLDAAVTWRAVPVDDGRVDIVLDVAAGPRVTLAALGLRGNKKLATGEIEAIFRAHGLVVGQPFDDRGRDAALLAVTTRYYDIGHVNAALQALPDVRSDDRSKISIAFEVREGDTFRLGKLSFAGALIAPARDYERLLAVRPRQTFDRSKIVAGIAKIRAMHRERGAGEPEVTTLTNVDPAKKTIDLTLEIKAP